jgi:hypothetical protein
VATRIMDSVMFSDQTRHTAEKQPDGTWILSWLPGRPLTRNQAITGMTIAEAVSRGLQPGDRLWPHLDGWASELGLSGPDAVVRASIAPGDEQR